MNIHVLYDDSKNINAYWLYTSYYNCIKKHYKNYDTKKYFSLEQLKLNDKLFIIDDHYLYNRNIWMQEQFIEKVNKLNIQVYIFTIEKIYNSHFQETLEFKKCADRFKKLKHFSSDAEDSEILKTPIAKQLFSNEFQSIRDNFNIPFQNKKNKIIFIGQLDTINNCYWYDKRKKILQELNSFSKYEIDFIKSDPNRTFHNYLNLLSEYKFVINPLGIGSFLSMRFYETLFVNSVVIQQYDESMRKKYDEISMKGLFFQDKDELYDIVNNIKYWEEYFCYNSIETQYLEEYVSINNFFEA